MQGPAMDTIWSFAADTILSKRVANSSSSSSPLSFAESPSDLSWSLITCFAAPGNARVSSEVESSPLPSASIVLKASLAIDEVLLVAEVEEKEERRKRRRRSFLTQLFWSETIIA